MGMIITPHLEDPRRRGICFQHAALRRLCRGVAGRLTVCERTDNRAVGVTTAGWSGAGGLRFAGRSNRRDVPDSPSAALHAPLQV